MKSKLFTALLVSGLALAGIANAAVTVSIKNFTSASVGNPIVSAAGVAAPLNTVFASAGIFSSLPNFATATASEIALAFTPIDGAPVSNTGFTGVFTGNDLSSGAYPANFSGAPAYILVGNAATLSTSTLVAVYSAGINFTAVDGAGNANVALNGTTAANWVFGTQRAITTQPTVSGAAFTTGIQLVASNAIPEPSAALLGAIGALGLLRRRRN